MYELTSIRLTESLQYIRLDCVNMSEASLLVCPDPMQYQLFGLKSMQKQTDSHQLHNIATLSSSSTSICQFETDHDCKAEVLFACVHYTCIHHVMLYGMICYMIIHHNMLYDVGKICLAVDASKMHCEKIQIGSQC